MNFAIIIMKFDIVLIIFRLFWFLKNFSKIHITTINRVIFYFQCIKYLIIKYSKNSIFNIFICVNNSIFENDCYAAMQIERYNLQNTMKLLSNFGKCIVINDWWNRFRYAFCHDDYLQSTVRFLSDFEKCVVINNWWNETIFIRLE